MAADAIVSIDREGKILLMNPVAEETFGYGRDEAAGLSLAELIVPEQSREFFHACMYGEPCRNMGMDLKRKDGSIFPAELSFSPEMKSEGGSERTIIIRDVTERRLAEEAIQSAALFPIQNPEPVLRIHRDGPLLFSNPAADPVLAQWRAESAGVIPARVQQAVEAALNEGVSREIELQIAGRDFSFVVTPIMKNHYATLYGRDVTESKQAEQALRRSEARHRSYTEVTGQLGWTTNADGEIVEDSTSWRMYTGQTFDEMQGWGWSKAIHPDDVEITLAVWRKAVEDKQGYETEYRLRRHDGVYRHFLARGVPVLKDGGNVREWVGTCIDITERYQAEEALKISKEALRIANEQLEQRIRERTAELILTLENLEKSRNDLRKLASELVLAEERERKRISVILHDEVAQTLAAARMRIDLLRRMQGDDDSRRVLDEAQQLLVQAIRETRALMTDISNPVLYDMGLQVAVQSLTEEVKARNGISFSSSFSGNLKTLENDVEVMLFQLVKELVQNIVKHSGARKASIRIVEERDDIKVVVADDGLGFDAGNIGAVGLDGGFGLFSIRERVKSYHGKIKIESEPGKGAEVTVMLPKKAAGVAASRKTGKRKEKI
jgi:PAS domain S-box-containing protein